MKLPRKAKRESYGIIFLGQFIPAVKIGVPEWQGALKEALVKQIRPKAFETTEIA